MQKSAPPSVANLLAHAWVGVFLTLAGGLVATAESTDQTYRLTVPESAAVTTPDLGEMSQVSDGSSNTFPPQIWSLASTSSRGVVATFSVDQPFQHESVADASMDASLSLKLKGTTGDSQWILQQANSTTNESSGNPSASVRVESNGSGQADVELEVGFENTGNVPAGKYSATLIFTIAVP